MSMEAGFIFDIVCFIFAYILMLYGLTNSVKLEARIVELFMCYCS